MRKRSFGQIPAHLDEFGGLAPLPDYEIHLFVLFVLPKGQFDFTGELPPPPCDDAFASLK